MKIVGDSRAPTSIPAVRETTKTTGEESDPVRIDQFLWTSPQSQPATTAWVLYDESALYLRCDVADECSRAETTTLNGPVWKDSCVELFATPQPAVQDGYFNFEVNCVGTFHLRS